MTPRPRPAPRPHLLRRLVVRTWRVVRFVGYFGWQFLVSNATVLWEIITPGTAVSPAIIAVPLASRRRVEIVSIANLVTLTPGTLTVELVRDPPVLYVHGMFVRDPGGVRADLARLETMMLAALRPVGAGHGGPAGGRPAGGKAGGGKAGGGEGGGRG